MQKCVMKTEKAFFNSKLIQNFKMILLLISTYLLSIIDAGKPKIWCPEHSNFEEWPKSQIFIFHPQNPREYDYPDQGYSLDPYCFGTLLNSFTCAGLQSCAY